MTIIRVRRTLSAIEIEKYGRPKFTAAAFQKVLFGCEVRNVRVIPIAVSRQSAPESRRRFVDNLDTYPQRLGT